MSRDRVFATMCGLVVFMNLGRIVFAPLLDELIRVFALSNSTAGLVVSAVWVGGALLRVPVGWVMTRVDRHRVVLGIGGILVVACAFTALSGQIATLLGVRPVYLLAAGALSIGASSGGYFVAANPLVSELYPERVGRALGIHATAAQTAAVLAAPFVLLLLTILPLTWHAVFAVIAIFTLLLTLLFARATRHETLPSVGEGDRDFVSAVKSEWPLILLGVTIFGFTGFVWQGMFNFYELYMESKGLVDAIAKNMLTVVFLAGIPAFYFGGRLADRLPSIPYILTLLTGFVLAILTLTATRGLVPLILVSIGMGFVIHSLFLALDTYLLDTLPDENRASAYAVYSAIMMIIQAMGSSVVGTLTDVGYAFDTVFVGFAGGLGCIVVLLAVLHRLDRLPG